MTLLAGLLWMLVQPRARERHEGIGFRKTMIVCTVAGIQCIGCAILVRLAHSCENAVAAELERATTIVRTICVCVHVRVS